MNCPVCGSSNTTFAFNVPFLNTKNWHRDYAPDDEYVYRRCDNCGAHYSRTQLEWVAHDFATKCYNDGYKDFDGDITNPIGNRPTAHIKLLNTMFRHFSARAILDYGCGRGFAIDAMRQQGWMRVTGCDPYFPNRYNNPRAYDKFELITALEVLEHTYTIIELFKQFNNWMDVGGIVYATTDLTDNMPDIRTNYYTCPRVGHIVLHSSKSLNYVARQTGFYVLHLPKDDKSGMCGHLFIKEHTL